MTFVVNSNTKRPVRKPFFQHFVDEIFNGNDLTSFLGSEVQFSRPAANVIETDDSYKLELAVPGMSKKDIQINVEKDVLTISAEKTDEINEGETYKRRGFNYNKFSRSFTLSDKIDVQNIKASFKNGVLTITLAKKDEAKEIPARSIEIS